MTFSEHKNKNYLILNNSSQDEEYANIREDIS